MRDYAHEYRSKTLTRIGIFSLSNTLPQSERRAARRQGWIESL